MYAYKMNDKVFRYIKWLKYLLFGAAALAFAALLILSNLFPQPSVEFAGSAGAAQGVDALLIVCGIILALAILAVLGFAVVNIVKNPSNGRYTLVSAAVLVFLFGVCWLLSSAEPVVKTIGGYFDNALELRWADTGLYVAYVMLAAAVGIIIFCEVRAALNRRANRKE